MKKLPGIFVLALGAPLLLAACGDDEPAAGGDQTATTVAKCTETMKEQTKTNARMKVLAGKEDKFCSCLVTKIKGDSNLKDEERTPIFAALQSKPGSAEAKTAQGKISDAGNKAMLTHMTGCAKEAATN